MITRRDPRRQQTIGEIKGTAHHQLINGGPAGFPFERDNRIVIADLSPFLRGWGTYFRTGNAVGKFRQADEYVVFRHRGLMIKKRGRNLRAGQAQARTKQWFSGHGLHCCGTVRYPKAA